MIIKFKICIRSIILPFFLILSIFSDRALAQISLLSGVNYCEVRNNHLIENQKGIFTYHFGVSARYYPLRNLPRFSIQNELLFSQKGYQQNLDKNYKYHFNYISIPFILNYALLENFSINVGVEYSELLFTNIKYGSKTYNHNDFGIVLGFSCFDKKRINIYSSVTYGLSPMLDYYRFDKYGNFVKEVHDLKNICFSVGIKVNIYNEEIHFY